MQLQTQFANGVNPWAQLFNQGASEPMTRRDYRWDTLPADKLLYMEKDRVRQASKLLAQYLKRKGIKGRAHATILGRPCVWWEYL